MGSRTANLSLYKPERNESGWGDFVNNNEEIIDAAITQELADRAAGDTATLAAAKAYTDAHVSPDDDSALATKIYVDGQDAATLTSSETYTDSAVASEASTRNAADSVLASAITTESSARSSADTTLQSNIDSEVTARIAGDSSTLSNAESYTDSSIATEVTNRNSAIAVETSRAQAAESSEASTRASADSTESAARTTGDATTLSSAEGYTDSSIATEVTNRNTAIAVETTRAEAAESSEATTRASADATEVTNRNAAIAVETSARTSADTTNAAAITAEQVRALAAEALAELLSHKDVANGYPGLDSLGFLKLLEFPVVNSPGNGGFISNGRFNSPGGDNAGQPASGQIVLVANQVNAIQFTLPCAFTISRLSSEIPTISGGTALTLSAAANASGGSTVYTGTFANGANNAFAGMSFVIAGFTNAANNGTFACTASSVTQITLSNASGTAETHAGTATPTSTKFGFALYDVNKNLLCQAINFDGTNVATGQTKTFSPVTLPPGVYWMAQTVDNPNTKFNMFLANSARQILGNLATYNRMGISSNPYSSGFPSSLGTVDGSNTATAVVLWEMV